ncbi:MAG: hypothetical protein AAFP70_06505 [Calditrichota bacterium]
MKNRSWKSYLLEFFSIFIAVISAFALNSWNENRRDYNAETKILSEISNGLQKDIKDIQENMMGHEWGIDACNYFVRLVRGEVVGQDSVAQHFLRLTRDFISIQNRSGYEALKSKGLEIVSDDSLRYAIISLYEYDFTTLKKLEEEYAEMQFYNSHFSDLNTLLSQYFVFDKEGQLVNIDLPLQLTFSQKKDLLSRLFKIEMNRKFILRFYSGIEEKVKKIKQMIRLRLENK